MDLKYLVSQTYALLHHTFSRRLDQLKRITHRLIASTSDPHCNESHFVEMIIPGYMWYQTLSCTRLDCKKPTNHEKNSEMASTEPVKSPQIPPKYIKTIGGENFPTKFEHAIWSDS